MTSRPAPRTLLLCPPIDETWERLRTGETNLRRPHLGMQYLMAVLNRAGYPFRLVDPQIRRLRPEELTRMVREEGFDVVGIHVNSMTRAASVRYIEAVKRETGAPVLVGGPGAVEAEVYLSAGADAACLGEAEDRIVALVDALAGRGPALAEVPGILFRGSGGEPCATAPVAPIEDLDRLPFPHRPRELVPLYGEPVNPAQNGTYVSLIATRGCPFHCTFCTSHAWWGNRVRARTPENIVAEIEAVLAEWPRAYLTFVDDVFGPSEEWVERFCGLVRERGLAFSWACILHPLSFRRRREAVYRMLAEAGCNCISFGAQSGAPEILKNVRRSPAEPEELAQAVQVAKKNGIFTIVTYIFGLPGETEETIGHSVSWALANDPHLVDFHPLFVLPHSEIEREYRGKSITSLSPEAIERACATAFRRFYLRPRAVWRLAAYILRRNPRYLLRLLYSLRMLAVHALFQKGYAASPPAAR